MPRQQLAAFAGAAVLVLVLLGFVLYQFVLAPRIAFTNDTVLTILSGAVEVQPSGQTQFRAAQDGMALRAGDRVRTQEASRAVITFFEGSTMELEPNTEVAVTSLLRGRTTRPSATAIAAHQVAGTTWSRVGAFADPSSLYQIDTPTGVIIVRSTLLELSVDSATGRTEVTALQGSALTRAQGVEVEIPPNTQTNIEPNQPPTAPKLVPLPSERLRVFADAPLWARLVDPLGRTVGHIAPGLEVNQAPRSLVNLPQLNPRAFELAVTQPGQYSIVLEGGSEGEYRFIVQGISQDTAIFTQGVQGSIKLGQRFLGNLTLVLQGGRLTSGQLGAFVPLTTEAGPGRFVRTQLATQGVALTATAVAVQGTPTPYVTRTPTTTATGTTTPSPTPTDTPTMTTTPRPVPTIGRTPSPSSTATAVATNTPTPSPVATASPAPPTPSPTASPAPPTPSPTASPALPTPSPASSPAPTPLPPTPTAGM